MNHHRRGWTNGQRRPNPGTPVEGFEALSESMRRLVLNRPPPPLLERPGEQGYIHPHDESRAAAGATSGGSLRYPERPGQPLCKQFLKYGYCYYGFTCTFDHPGQGDRLVQRVPLNESRYPQFNHPRQGDGLVQRVPSNELGYPPQMRASLNDSGYPPPMGGSMPSGFASQYMYEPRSPMFVSPQMVPNPGWTPFPGGSVPSRFASQYMHEPYGPTVVSPQMVQNLGRTYFPGGSVPSGFASQYMHEPYGPTFISPRMVPNPGWTHFPAPINPLASSSAPVYQGAYPTMYSAGVPSSNSRENHMFPERPGQPLCLTYMRTGNCVLRSACGLHHPSERITSCALSPVGLPLRPEAPPCDFYVLHGSCDHGSSCIFDHPYDPSASSSEPGQSRPSRRERHI